MEFFPHTVLDFFVLDVIKHACNVAPYQQKRHLTSAGTSVTGKLQKETNQANLSSSSHKVRKTNLPTVAITLSKRGAHPLVNLLLHTTVANSMRERPSCQTATMFTCNKFGRLRQTGSAHRGLVAHPTGSLRNQTNHVSFRLCNSCPGLCGSSMPPLQTQWLVTGVGYKH